LPNGARRYIINGYYMFVSAHSGQITEKRVK
jgi:hypothetical protein